MGGSPDPPETQTVEQKSEPWEGVQPFLKGMYPLVQDVGEAPVPYFPGQTLASLSPETGLSWDLTGARALGGSPVTSAAQQEAFNTLSGQYLGQQNPYLDQLSQSIGNDVMGQVGSRFAASGQRFGGPAEQQVFARTLTDRLAPYMFGEYGREREAMGRMAALAPTLGREDYFDLGQLQRVGQERETRGQQEITDEMSRYYHPYEEPYQRLGWMSGILHGGGALGGTSFGTQQYQQPGLSPLAYAGAGLQTVGNLLPFFLL